MTALRRLTGAVVCKYIHTYIHGSGPLTSAGLHGQGWLPVVGADGSGTVDRRRNVTAAVDRCGETVDRCIGRRPGMAGRAVAAATPPGSDHGIQR